MVLFRLLRIVNNKPEARINPGYATMPTPPMRTSFN
jgi:hypothetical protein